MYIIIIYNVYLLTAHVYSMSIECYPTKYVHLLKILN